MRRTPCAIGLAMFTLMLSPSYSDVIEFNGDGGTANWSNPDNWDANAVPTAADRAVIPNTFDVEVDGDYTVDTIEIQSGGTLTVLTGNTLTLQNNNHNDASCPFPSTTCSLRDHSELNDQLILEEDAVLSFTTESHTLSGPGEIVCGDATVTMASGVQFANDVDGGIYGTAVIEGDGSFLNKSSVEPTPFSADIRMNCEFDDVAGAEWIVGCGAFLTFQIGSVSLEGDFVNDSSRNPGAGWFDLGDDVATCGTWYWDCESGVNADPSAEFRYANFVDLSGSCSNPASGGNGTCNDPWIIDYRLNATTCIP